MENFLDADFEVLKTGYLVKSPPERKITDKWRRRYCVLCSRESSKNKNYFFEYYVSEKEFIEKQPIKKFDLEGAKLSIILNGVREPDRSPCIDHNFVLKLALSSRYDNREMFLCAESKGEMVLWFDRISFALNKVKQIQRT